MKEYTIHINVRDASTEEDIVTSIMLPLIVDAYGIMAWVRENLTKESANYVIDQIFAHENS